VIYYVLAFSTTTYCITLLVGEEMIQVLTRVNWDKTPIQAAWG